MKDPELEAVKYSRCPLCASEVQETYDKLVDKFEVVPGTFSVFECMGCGVGFTNPLPQGNLHLLYPKPYLSSVAEDASSTSLFSKLEDWYSSDQSAFDFNLLQKAMRKSISEVDSYLDIGCGTGSRVLFASEHGCKKAKGIDSFDFFNAPIDKEIHFQLTEVCDYFPEQKYEIVSLFHVLEHVPDPKAIVKHIVTSILKEDGYLMIQVPNFGSLERRLFSKKWFGLDIPRHLWHYSAKFLKSFLSAYNLSPISVFQKNAVLHPVTLVPSLSRDMDVQRIRFMSTTDASAYWKVMNILRALLTVVVVPFNFLASMIGQGTMLTIISQNSKNAHGKG